MHWLAGLTPSVQLQLLLPLPPLQPLPTLLNALLPLHPSPGPGRAPYQTHYYHYYPRTPAQDPAEPTHPTQPHNTSPTRHSDYKKIYKFIRKSECPPGNTHIYKESWPGKDTPPRTSLAQKRHRQHTQTPPIQHKQPPRARQKINYTKARVPAEPLHPTKPHRTHQPTRSTHPPAQGANFAQNNRKYIQNRRSKPGCWMHCPRRAVKANRAYCKPRPRP